MSQKLITTWDGHFMFGDYLSSLCWALRQQEVIDQYRIETDDWFVPSNTTIGREIDAATGADMAFLQRFSDWHERSVFGRLEDVFGDEA